ncbi:hypothetical protein ACFQ88_33205 [Paenibacillus sp. NPDC056579]|uniref:hypothetical protein n=1 Tax=Paenibacillus sp. NPDC056579 TaxID=3345871 RepID=UPI0036B91A69
MANSMYSRSKHYRNASALLLAVMLGLAGFKGYYSWEKTDLYAKAMKELADGRELEAEKLFHDARGNSMIQYKDQEIDEALEKLQPVTELKRELLSMAGDLQNAAAVNDVPSLVKVYESFQTMKTSIAKQDEAAKKRLADAEAIYHVEEQLTTAFSNVKAALLGNLEAAAAKKTNVTDSTVAYLLQIPAVYFKDEKTKKAELNERLKAYDQARMDTLFKKKSFAEVVDEAAGIRKFYTASGVQAEWFVPMVETYAQNTLAGLLKNNDMKTFIDHAKKYQGVKEFADSRSKVNTYIQTTLKGQFTRAEQLTAAKKFEEAIELYGVLNAYRDTSKEVAAVEQRWLEADPLQLLRKVTDSSVKLANVLGAKALWGSKQAAVGIADGKSIIVARLLPDQKVDKIEAGLDGSLTVKSMQVSEQLSVQNQPVLLIEAASKTRKTRFIVYVYDAKSADLRKALDVEADSLTQDKSRSGMLVADNPAGERAGEKAYYEYRNGQYVTVDIKPEAEDIVLTELPKQKTGAVVRFQASIMSAEGNTAIVALNDDFVLLSGSFRFKTGPAVITGTLVEKGRANTNNGQSSVTYKIIVTGLDQGQSESPPASTPQPDNSKNRRTLP